MHNSWFYCTVQHTLKAREYLIVKQLITCRARCLSWNDILVVYRANGTYLNCTSSIEIFSLLLTMRSDRNDGYIDTVKSRKTISRNLFENLKEKKATAS